MEWPFCLGETIGLAIGGGSTLVVGSAWAFALFKPQRERISDVAFIEEFMARGPQVPASTALASTVKKKRRVNPQPQAVQAQPRPKKKKKKKRVQWLEGPLSRVRGLYYVDEDSCDHRLITLLRDHKLNVTTTYEEGRCSAKDPLQLAHSTSQRRVIITCDGDFVDLHEAGARHSGIIHAPKGPQWFGEILRVALTLTGEVAAR